MKKVNYIVLLLGLMIVSSCNDWLSVSPKTEITQKELFESESGFKDAMIGAYIQLDDNKAYGSNLTMETVEYLVSFWDVTTKTTGQYLSLHNYSEKGCEEKIQEIYAQLYTVITSANSILDNIETAKNNGVFKTTGMYEVIKGEALAMRAMCHLDILRLFGPVPSLATDKNILSYVTKVGKMPERHISYASYCELLLGDIRDAEELLKEYDPIVTTIPSKDDFLTSRELRLNYYAVRALSARANLYLGNNGDALIAAKEVIAANNELFQLGTLGDLNNKDYTLKKEHIFALHDFQLESKFNDKFVTGNLKKGSNATTVKRDLYGNTGTDIRELNLWELKTQGNTSKTNVILKYAVQAANLLPGQEVTDISDTRIPILRIAEMYLIVVETAPLDEALIYWDKFKKSRNIATNEITEITRKSEVMKEYRKEFYAEGQMFYVHKRMNSPKTDILWFPKAATALNYVLPLPKTELID